MGTEATRLAERPAAPDPRPRVVSTMLIGSRCEACGHPAASVLERCPECSGRCTPTEFGPVATVFAATVLRVPVPGRVPPYALAYIDLDGGPRILAHVDGTDAALEPGDRVRIVGTTAEGDPLVAADTTTNEPSA